LGEKKKKSIGEKARNQGPSSRDVGRKKGGGGEVSRKETWMEQ